MFGWFEIFYFLLSSYNDQIKFTRSPPLEIWACPRPPWQEDDPCHELFQAHLWIYIYITITIQLLTIIQAHLRIYTTIIHITLLFSNDNGGWIDLFVSGYVCLDFNVKSWLVDLWEWIDMDGYHFCQYVYIWIWVFNVDCWLFDEWYQARIGRPHFCPPGFEFHIE